MIPALVSRAALAALVCLASACSTTPLQSPDASLAIVGATIYPSPEGAPIANGVVLVRGGKIVAVGPAADIVVPPGASTLRAEGRYLVAGFQNSHVHFTEAKWEGAATQPAAQLAANLREMALRHGFTTLVDTGSLLSNTVALRSRIESGEVAGPRILTAGIPFYPVNGIPYYLKGMDPELLKLLNTPATPEEGRAIVRRQVAAGADLVKLFTGSGQGAGRVMPMRPDISAAIVDEAHKLGKIAVSHASNYQGMGVALDARVDVIAHSLDDVSSWSPALVTRMRERDMALIPTLTLFGRLADIAAIEREVGDYARAGGQILFGTDGGFIPYYGTDEEFTRMARAGLDWRAILASLTTAPAARFNESSRRGRVAPGMDADLVILDADPSRDPVNLSKVRSTVRGGRIVHANN